MREQSTLPPMSIFQLCFFTLAGGLTYNLFLKKKEEYGFNLLPGGGLVGSMGKNSDIIRQSLRHHRDLTAQEELELGFASMAGDLQARQALISSQYKLVFSIVIAIANKTRRFDMMDDLFQTGVRVVIGQVERFDPTKAKLSTFVYWPITKAIHQELNSATTGESTEELPEIAQDSPRYQALLSVLNQILSPEQSEVIQYRVSEEKTFKEIAELLGKSESFWKRRFAEAQACLKRYRAYLENLDLY